MSTMEDDAKRFLRKVVSTLTIAILWLIINMTWGIYLGWMVVIDHVNTGNIVFYIWFVLSLALMLFLFAKIWRTKKTD
jgi:FtsH-binding integral membrane protein